MEIRFPPALLTLRTFPEELKPVTDVRAWTPAALAALADALRANLAVRGAKPALADVAHWRAAVEGNLDPSACKPRSVEQFAALVTELLAHDPTHTLFRHRPDHDAWCPVYVDRVWYEDASENSYRRTPAHCTLRFWWNEFGTVHYESAYFEYADCVHRSLADTLAGSKLELPTAPRREAHAHDLARYTKIRAAVGRQFLARGLGLANVDGNPDKISGYARFALDTKGQPARVVLDVFHETPEKRERETTPDPLFWCDPRKNLTRHGESRGAHDDDEAPAPPTLPTHPMVAIFDLRLHLRLRVHVAQLTERPAEPALLDKIVLPNNVRELLRVLLREHTAFQDVIHGKGAGTVILCAGPPGTGKTLTAEAHAEGLGRPLYTVHASQLGTDAEELEANLLRVFARAERWNAVLLLDEADVYVASRGESLVQNAIVGVFLRVLEYYQGLLFLTTNRPELVDDAIASRCVARVLYQLPAPDELRRIWTILAANAGVTLGEGTLDRLLAAWPNLSGRDVRNLLALARHFAPDATTPLEFAMFERARPFKATDDVAARASDV